MQFQATVLGIVGCYSARLHTHIQLQDINCGIPCLYILVEQLVIDKCCTPEASLSGSARVCQG